MWWREAGLLVLASGAILSVAIISGPVGPDSSNLAEPKDQISTTSAPSDSTMGSFESSSADSNLSTWVHRLASDRLARRSPLTGPPPKPTTTSSLTVSAIVATPAQPPTRIVPDVEASDVTVSPPPTRPARSPGLGIEVPESVRRWDGLIEKYSARYGLNPNLVAAVMMTESGGNPAVTSPKGAIGLMQVINSSADPETSVRDGTRRLANELIRYGGDLQLSLAAYNAGAGAVDRFGGIPPYPETEFYVYIVLNRFFAYSTS